MKKLVYTTAAMIVLIGSSASAATSLALTVAAKPKPAPTQPSPDTDSFPTCPYNDPNGCGIFK